MFRRTQRDGVKISAARVAAAATEALVMGKGAYIARFAVFAERVLQSDVVCVVGNVPALGDGDVEKAVPLADCDSPVWQTCVALPREARDVTYRFVIKNKANSKVVLEDVTERKLQLNEGDSRFLSEKAGGAAPVVFAPTEASIRFPTRWKGAGIALPVFSIRSRASCGVGEFADLPCVVDFCVQAGYQLLQLLPVNDTTSFGTARDSYPYSAVSSFALHPQYINIEKLGEMPPSMAKEFRAEKEKLNALDKIDYVRMMEVKNRYICKMYRLHKDEFLESKEFTSWFAANQDWLVSYALFHFFMQVNGSSNYDQWGARKHVTLADMNKLAAPDTFHFEYLGVAYYTQFHLHKQLYAAAEYAAERQVVFKGDLPIGVNRYCVDTWVNPHLFRLNMQAGAPPDAFSAHGQNWAFPTYDWEAMSKDNYAWWRSRLGHMAKYFHAYRIDHILGFFRIWEIPESSKTGMSGRFFPAHGISRQELETRGLWDIDRYVKPYVRDGILQEMFGENWWKIKERFFEPLWHDRLKFKAEFDTEKKVEKALELPEGSPESEVRFNKNVKDKLFSIFNNVCLLADVESSDLFHPRFKLQDTSSYAELPSNEWKGALHNLHDDYMYRRQEQLWRKNGLERLPMMKSASNMLVCGEDLGLIPHCVPPVLEETSILSLAVQRMPAGDAELGIPSEYKYECVATTSSHDTSTFRGWWEEIESELRMRYWTNVMKRNGSITPPVGCTTEIVEWAVADHLASPAMWTVFPLQDLLGMDEELRRADAAAEQINDPSNPEHIWCFRLHINLEDVMAKKSFMNKLVQLNKTHGRGAAY